MRNLTDLIQFIPASNEETPEDIFAAASGLIFPDDLRNQHGEPGALLIYRSTRFGEIELTSADPDKESDRRLFGHYLWNAGILMAERLSGQRMVDGRECAAWDIKGHSVLELGAGVGLTGIVAALAAARESVISDYPSQVILDNIRANIKRNSTLFGEREPRVQGHEWGVLDDDFSTANKHHFSRILAADCFWMPQVHHELAQSMLHFLSLEADSRVLLMAGFHTGRAKLAAFFDTAASLGLVPEVIYEENAVGLRREWTAERDGGLENITERKKWLVIARMQRL